LVLKVRQKVLEHIEDDERGLANQPRLGEGAGRERQQLQEADVALLRIAVPPRAQDLVAIAVADDPAHGGADDLLLGGARRLELLDVLDRKQDERKVQAGDSHLAVRVL